MTFSVNIETHERIKSKRLGEPMTSDVTVVFKSEGKKIKTALRVTVFQAAEEAEFCIRPECSGKGLVESVG